MTSWQRIDYKDRLQFYHCHLSTVRTKGKRCLADSPNYRCQLSLYEYIFSFQCVLQEFRACDFSLLTSSNENSQGEAQEPQIINLSRYKHPRRLRDSAITMLRRNNVVSGYRHYDRMPAADAKSQTAFPWRAAAVLHVREIVTNSRKEREGGVREKRRARFPRTIV